MILILESPHKDEFKGEPGPARGATGHAISSQLMNVIGLRQFSDYGLILMNAIQYQCSLGKPTAKHRDTVFRRVWGSGGAEDFKDRLKTTYRPGDVIVNCCTKVALSVGADETLLNYANQATKLLAENEMGWFQRGGNTYIVLDQTAGLANSGGAADSFDNGVDQIIMITGLVDLGTGASFNVSNILEIV